MEHVKEYKYFGVTITNVGTYELQINDRISKL